MSKPNVTIEQMQQLIGTEQSLPARTQIAFAVMILIGLSWGGFALWVLTRRHVLLAGHRVIATRMASGFTAVFVLGSLALMRSGSLARPAIAAAGLGVVMLGTALYLHVRAQRDFERLTESRRALAREV